MTQTMEAMRYQGDASLTIDYTPGSAVVMGEVLVVGQIIGICISPEGIGASVLGALQIEGVFRLKKSGSSGPVFTQNDEVYWDVSNNLATAGPQSSTVKYAGLSVEAAGASQDFVCTDINKYPPQWVGYAVTTTTT